MNAHPPAAAEPVQRTPPLEVLFARAMACFEPFEAAPLLAVAVSGGSDSMALAALAADWCRARGGRVIGLIVDHGLRAESAGEARRTAGVLMALGIDTRILCWQGPKPRSRIQERARDARLDLLVGACRQIGAAHLLLGHHCGDQEETVAMRLEHGSGTQGLSGMSACRELDDLRLLRPLLRFTRAGLREWLRRAGIGWIDDPSNRDRRFWRARYRSSGSRPPPGELETIRNASADARCDNEMRRDAVAALGVTFHPLGWIDVDPAAWHAASVDVRAALVAAAIRCVTGTFIPVRRDAVDRLLAAFARGEPRRTLGHAIFANRACGLRIMREPRHLPVACDLAGGGKLLWDNRIFIESTEDQPTAAIQPADRQSIVRLPAEIRRKGEFPVDALLGMPALRRSGCDEWQHMLAFRGGGGIIWCFRPARAFTGVSFVRKAVACDKILPI
ncbi:MAG: tRNA lysidine(34) synthetase TilS [Geminicoccaceae bacterium]